MVIGTVISVICLLYLVILRLGDSPSEPPLDFLPNVLQTLLALVTGLLLLAVGVATARPIRR